MVLKTSYYCKKYFKTKTKCTNNVSWSWMIDIKNDLKNINESLVYKKTNIYFFRTNDIWILPWVSTSLKQFPHTKHWFTFLSALYLASFSTLFFFPWIKTMKHNSTFVINIITFRICKIHLNSYSEKTFCKTGRIYCLIEQNFLIY